MQAPLSHPLMLHYPTLHYTGAVAVRRGPPGDRGGRDEHLLRAQEEGRLRHRGASYRALCCVGCACVAGCLLFSRLSCGLTGGWRLIAHWMFFDGVAGSGLVWCLPRCKLRVFVCRLDEGVIEPTTQTSACPTVNIDCTSAPTCTHPLHLHAHTVTAGDGAADQRRYPGRRDPRQHPRADPRVDLQPRPRRRYTLEHVATCVFCVSFVCLWFVCCGGVAHLPFTR
jgi:hypothetical protein